MWIFQTFKINVHVKRESLSNNNNNNNNNNNF